MKTTKARLARWQALNQQRQAVNLSFQPHTDPIKRQIPFRQLSEDERHAEIEFQKATLQSATSISVVAEQQIAAIQVQEIAAFAQQERQQAASAEELQSGLSCREAFLKISKRDDLEPPIKGCSWAYWQWLWHTWLGNPHKVFLTKDVPPLTKDKLYYLGDDPTLGEILAKFNPNEGTDEYVVFLEEQEYERHSTKVKLITEAALMQLVKNPRYFQYGLDFKHPTPGFYLESNIHSRSYLDFSDICLKYSPALAQKQVAKQHAMQLPKPLLPSPHLSDDLQHYIEEARKEDSESHDLQLLIKEDPGCIEALNFLIAEAGFDDTDQTALLPVYDAYGNEGLEQLLNELRELHERDNELFAQIKRYCIDGHFDLKPLLEPDFQQIITQLHHLEPKARVMWSILLDSHMQAVEFDDFNLLAKSFIDFAQKIAQWHLVWPEDMGNLAQSENLHITLGRALTILENCLPVDRQAQFDCLPQLDLGPVGAIVAIGQQRKGYHFISDKALMRTKNCDIHSVYLAGQPDCVIKLESRIEAQVKASRENEPNCRLNQEDLTQALYQDSDPVRFDMHLFRFIGGHYYRPSIDFFKRAQEEIDKFEIKSYLKTASNGTRTVTYDPTKPSLMAIIAGATCGIRKVRFADLKEWRSILELLSKEEDEDSGSVLRTVLDWFQPPALHVEVSGQEIQCLPYDYNDSPSLPELKQLLEVLLKLKKYDYSDLKTQSAARDAYYLSFKDYNEDDFDNNPELFQSQIELINTIIQDPFGRNEELRYLDYDYNPDRLDYFALKDKQKSAVHIQHIQKGLIKILSTFNITMCDLATYVAINQLIDTKGYENAREVINYLSKISAYKAADKLTSKDLLTFIEDYISEDSLLADALIKHFPKSFNEHHFIRIVPGGAETYKNLPRSVLEKLEEFSPEISELLIDFWTEQSKAGSSQLANEDISEFLYYVTELKNTMADDKLFIAYLTKMLSTNALINANYNDINAFMMLMASQGIQFCAYILQECKDRKSEFQLSYVHALHGPLLPYLNGGEDKPIPPVTALSLITECLFSMPGNDVWVIDLLETLKKSYATENEKHLLSQEYFIKIISKAIKSAKYTPAEIIAYGEKLQNLLLPLAPEVTHALCYRFQDNSDELYQLLSEIEQKEADLQPFFLELLDKWVRQPLDPNEEHPELAIINLSEQFRAFLNNEELHLDTHDAFLRRIYQRAPYPNLKELQEWLVANEDLEQKYKAFITLPADYNQFNVNFARDKAKQIIALSEEAYNALEGDDLINLGQLLKDQVGKDIELLRYDFSILVKELTDLKAGEANAKDLFAIRMKLLAVATAILYMSSKPAPKSLNETQLVALLHWLKQGQTVGLQIDTGEGKSRMCMLASALMVAEGCAVDFVTSNNELAARDFTDFHAFFESLNISTNLINANSPYASYRKVGVNFTDSRSLRLFRRKALLAGKEAFELTQVEESKRALMLDEADDTIYDQTFDRCQVSRSITRFRNMDISWICTSAVEYIRSVKKELQENEVFTAFDIDLCPEQEIALFKRFIETKTPYFNDLLALQAGFQDEPEKYKEQIKTWLKAAANALEFKENVDFEIQSGRLRKTERGTFVKASDAFIVVKGRVDRDSRWGHWVHPCLEARMNIEREEKIARGEYVTYDAFDIGSEKRVLASSTAYNLLRYYKKGQMLGVSGTLGSTLECAEAHESYDMSLFAIPRHKAKRRIDLPIRIAKNNAEHYFALQEYIEKANAAGRPVVIFCKTKEEALQFEQFCKDELSDTILGASDKEGNRANLQLITAEMSGTPLEAARVAQARKKGMITISTNMIGRGTDITTSEEYPLEVLCTYLPTIREYLQMVGRAGRYGQKGFSRLVLNKEDLPNDFLHDSGFFLARRAYLLEKQEQLSINTVQKARLIDNCCSELMEDMTEFFFRQIHSMQKVDPAIEGLVDSWGDLIDEFERVWSSYRDQVAMEQTFADTQTKMVEFFKEIEEKHWQPFIEKCKLVDGHFEEAPKDFARYVKHLKEKPRSSVETKSLQTDIYDDYDSANAGTAAVYNSLFQDTIALFTGERKWFANTRAWFNDPDSTILFADTLAILSGKRELFANLRATLAKVLHHYELHDLAEFIMPDYDSRLVEVSAINYPV